MPRRHPASEATAVLRVDSEKLENNNNLRAARALKETRDNSTRSSPLKDTTYVHAYIHTAVVHTRKRACRLLKTPAVLPPIPPARRRRERLRCHRTPNITAVVKTESDDQHHLLARAAAAGKKMAKSSAKTVSRMNACGRRARAKNNQEPRVFAHETKLGIQQQQQLSVKAVAGMVFSAFFVMGERTYFKFLVR